jgi:hypothetical protein
VIISGPGTVVLVELVESAAREVDVALGAVVDVLTAAVELVFGSVDVDAVEGVVVASPPAPAPVSVRWALDGWGCRSITTPATRATATRPAAKISRRRLCAI